MSEHPDAMPPHPIAGTTRPSGLTDADIAFHRRMAAVAPAIEAEVARMLAEEAAAAPTTAATLVDVDSGVHLHNPNHYGPGPRGGQFAPRGSGSGGGGGTTGVGSVSVRRLPTPPTGSQATHGASSHTGYVPSRDARVDEHGQTMPFTHGEFDAARVLATALHGDHTHETSIAQISGQHYIIKNVDTNTAGITYRQSPYIQQRNEAATVDGMRALGYGHLAPGEAYHVVGSDGRHYAVIKMEPGTGLDRTVTSFDAAVQHVSHEDLQRAYLGSYLLGMRDRHDGNVLYDQQTHRLMQIDHGFGLKIGSEIEARDTVRDMWAAKSNSGPLTFSPHILKDALDRQPAVEQALAKYHLTPAETFALRDRFAVIRWLYTGQQPPTVDALRDYVGEGEVYVS